jgi:hypothetical protein
MAATEEPITIGDGSLTITWRDQDFTHDADNIHISKPDAGKTVKGVKLNNNQEDRLQPGQFFSVDIVYSTGRKLRAFTDATGGNLKIKVFADAADAHFLDHFDKIPGTGTAKPHYASKLAAAHITSAVYVKGANVTTPTLASGNNAITIYYDV